MGLNLLIFPHMFLIFLHMFMSTVTGLVFAEVNAGISKSTPLITMCHWSLHMSAEEPLKREMWLRHRRVSCLHKPVEEKLSRKVVFTAEVSLNREFEAGHICRKKWTEAQRSFLLLWLTPSGVQYGRVILGSYPTTGEWVNIKILYLFY